MNPRGIGKPEIGKVINRALRLRTPQGAGGNLQFTHAVAHGPKLALAHCLMLTVSDARYVWRRACSMKYVRSIVDCS